MQDYISEHSRSLASVWAIQESPCAFALILHVWIIGGRGKEEVTGWWSLHSWGRDWHNHARHRGPINSLGGEGSPSPFDILSNEWQKLPQPKATVSVKVLSQPSSITFDLHTNSMWREKSIILQKWGNWRSEKIVIFPNTTKLNCNPDLSRLLLRLF